MPRKKLKEPQGGPMQKPPKNVNPKLYPCKKNHALPWMLMAALILLECGAVYTIQQRANFVPVLPGDKVMSADEVKEQTDEMDNCRQMLKLAQKRAGGGRIKAAIKEAIDKIDNGQRSEAEDELKAALGGE